jgi:hypothetical protein
VYFYFALLMQIKFCVNASEERFAASAFAQPAQRDDTLEEKKQKRRQTDADEEADEPVPVPVANKVARRVSKSKLAPQNMKQVKAMSR